MDIQVIIIASLKILFVWAAMRPGMILHPLCLLVNRMLMLLPARVYLHVRKPISECLFCMSSVWGFVFTIDYAEISWKYLGTLMAIGGLNYLIQLLIPVNDDH